MPRIVNTSHYCHETTACTDHVQVENVDGDLVAGAARVALVVDVPGDDQPQRGLDHPAPAPAPAQLPGHAAAGAVARPVVVVVQHHLHTLPRHRGQLQLQNIVPHYDETDSRGSILL